MLIERISPFTKKKNAMEIDVTQEQLNRWAGGELIQNVMPELTPDEREFIMTGIMAEEWEAMAGEN